MREVLFVCVSLSLIVAVHVLWCVPGYCDKHPCTSPESCPPGEGLHQNLCSCCKQCVPLIRKYVCSAGCRKLTRFLAEGGACLNVYDLPQDTRCEDGTQCIERSTETSISTQSFNVTNFRICASVECVKTLEAYVQRCGKPTKRLKCKIRFERTLRLDGVDPMCNGGIAAANCPVSHFYRRPVVPTVSRTCHF
ncbi:hypothetical protein FQR65_LT01335 [Abscondita terminalis]|nr:hypothetical protein FQR65_LT01335 [Abscondita terminalis]